MREQDLLKRLGAQIRIFRKAAGLTLEQLANAVDVSYRTISDIERGRQFTSLGHLYKISKALNKELPDLFSWAASKKSQSSSTTLEQIAEDIAAIRKTSRSPRRRVSR